MGEYPDEAGDIESLNSDVSFLPVEVTSQPTLEETSTPSRSDISIPRSSGLSTSL